MFNLNEEEGAIFCDPDTCYEILSGIEDGRDYDTILERMIISSLVPEKKVYLIEQKKFFDWLNENSIVFVKGK